MDEKPTCPKCQQLMGKAGTPLSGTVRVQRFRCAKCGITTTNPISSNHHLKYIKLGMDELKYTQLKLRALKSSQSVEDYLLTYLFREH